MSGILDVADSNFDTDYRRDASGDPSGRPLRAVTKLNGEASSSVVANLALVTAAS
jgi:hypothetical protein